MKERLIRLSVTTEPERGAPTSCELFWRSLDTPLKASAHALYFYWFSYIRVIYSRVKPPSGAFPVLWKQNCVKYGSNMNLGTAYHGESSFRNNNFLTAIRYCITYLLILIVCTEALGSIERSTVLATCMTANPIALLAQWLLSKLK